MRLAMRALCLLLCGAFALGACSVERATSTDTGDESHLDDGAGDLLRGPRAAADGIAAIEAAVGASPARIRDVLIYPEFLDAEVQDPALPEHLDEYEYRDSDVGAGEAVLLSGSHDEIEASLFPTTAVDWSDIPRIVKRVERAARNATPIRIEDARVGYLIAGRSTSVEDDGRVEITAYINGPRRNGRAELTAIGEIIELTVE
jgi:hypothetical protein